MFNTVIDQVKAVRNETEVVIVKLGTVTELTGGKAKVKLYGDSAASNKFYQYIDTGWVRAVNDKVALLPQGKTYIILGKVTDATPVEKYATKTYVDDTFLVKAFANKLDNDSHKVELSSNELLPGADNTINLGSSAKMYASAYFKKAYIDGTEIQLDRIKTTSGGTTYALVLSYSSSTATLTPSADNTFALGTSSVKFKEAYLGNIRGTWKSGQNTERALSWNSSNALVPDSNNAVDLGSASYTFKQLFLNALVGAKFQYSSNAANNLAWSSATDLLPNNTNAVNLGSSTKQLSKVYAKEFYINGTLIDISGITLDKLTAKYNTYTRTLTMTANATGATILPSVNNTFELGSASYKFKNIYAETFTGDLDGKILNGSSYNLSWDASHNLIPNTTNYLSLGTSSKQYKNVYGQNLYVNGTAVTSDKSLKKDIKELEEKHLTFFRCLRPVQFKYKDGESGRTHTGFIAQEVMDAIHEAGMTSQDMAVVVKDPESGQYYLRYEEIIAVQAQVIQNMQKKVDSLEARIARLEALLERSIK